MQSDPIGLAGGISTYGYVDQSPLLYINPFRLQSILVCGNPANAAAYAAAAIGVSSRAGGGSISVGAGASGAAPAAASTLLTGDGAKTDSCLPEDKCQKFSPPFEKSWGCSRRDTWKCGLTSSTCSTPSRLEKYHGTVVSSISDNGKRFYVGTWNQRMQ
ncbi:hypothetical protein [Stenotrophomonas acidaminiphila]|uniref:hypothetical protein n=1 Tax=Stenotrophomonas acidaminiphila TaxID=128780 RepID=UPI0024AD746E|nr:hypothetical protein [Stenotrophomonas acidaminiphila]WHL20522.1 hypothetical protein QLF99_00915 [Stenotrophomonas acidaminiphila]